MSARFASFDNPFVINRSAAPASTLPLSGKQMRRSTCSATQNCGFDPAKVRDFMRSKFPHDTVKSVAAALDESPRTVENWLAFKACPKMLSVGKMIAIWGVEFIVSAMVEPPEWARDALAREEFAELERRSDALKHQLRSPDKD